jgi:sedoheptulokinase
MAVLALDVGTTKICALVIDEDSGAVLEVRHSANAFLPVAWTGDRRQDPERIASAVRELAAGLAEKYRPVRCIGVTGQMHGILYVDASGRAVSPLYTWQDASASLPMESGESYAAYLAKIFPGPIAAGYGLATLFYHLSTRQVPKEAVKICSIGDYVTMRLCGSTSPVIHATNAGGMGFFDVCHNRFDEEKMSLAGIDPSLLPRMAGGMEVLGEYADGVPVSVSIGDNQAAFLGSVQDSQGSVLVNIGTGSQISLVSRDVVNVEGVEIRPFFEDGFLIAGASLCGGRAYALLERFFRQVLQMAGITDERSLYNEMDALVENAGECSLVVNTLFAGSRQDPSVRGNILNISEDNFNPAQLATGFLNGAVHELYSLYLPLKKENDHKRLIGAGNGIRKSRPLRRILARQFGRLLEIPLYQEEAAYGAALFALSCTGYFETVSQAQYLVRCQASREDENF